jgi:hypothetical protein
MTAALRPYPKFKAFDTAGNALAGGKLYTYQAGTSTNLATYTTPAASVANANPVIMDANGEADVWYLARSYKLVLKDANDVVQWTVDNFDGSSLVITGALDEIKGSDIASAATIDLSTATGNFVHITGTTTITGVTLGVGAERTVVFDGILTLTHNATSLILPGNQNIITAAGDRAIIRGESTGNVRVIAYIRAAAAVPNQAKGADIASAATVNLDAATGDFVHITGTTTITAITLASGKEATVVFDGALTLTHNATTLILPGGASITTAAGDRAIFRGDGSGNVRCIAYVKANGQSITLPFPQATTAQIGMPMLAASTAQGDVVFDPLNPQFIRTATAAAAPTSAQILYGDGWRTPDVALVSTASIAASALSVSIPIPSAYATVQIEVEDVYVAAAGGANVYARINNSTAGVYDYLIHGVQSNSASTVSDQSVAARNQSGLFLSDRLSSDVKNPSSFTLTLCDGQDGTKNTQINGLIFGGINTGLVPLYVAQVRGIYASTAIATSIDLVPGASTFMGGKVKVWGKKG